MIVNLADKRGCHELLGVQLHPIGRDQLLITGIVYRKTIVKKREKTELAMIKAILHN